MLLFGKEFGHLASDVVVSSWLFKKEWMRKAAKLRRDN